MQGLVGMIMDRAIVIVEYSPEQRPSIRRILSRIGWAEHYIRAMEDAGESFSKDKENFGVYLARSHGDVVGYLFIQYYAWNRLCQIQGLAVDPAVQRRGIASALVARAEEFAHAKLARGVYVDTPTTNISGQTFYEARGYQLGYRMPRYYEDQLDGVTYQKFFAK